MRFRKDLPNTGWVRHTLESALWAVLTTQSFEEALVQAVNLGNDADTTGAVAGAIAGAIYGLSGIPTRWKDVLHGEYPLQVPSHLDRKRFCQIWQTSSPHYPHPKLADS